jgi:hypothetical protein
VRNTIFIRTEEIMFHTHKLYTRTKHFCAARSIFAPHETPCCSRETVYAPHKAFLRLRQSVLFMLQRFSPMRQPFVRVSRGFFA